MATDGHCCKERGKGGRCNSLACFTDLVTLVCCLYFEIIHVAKGFKQGGKERRKGGGKGGRKGRKEREEGKEEGLT